MTVYIAKIPEFNGKDIETSPQEWLDQVTKAGDTNRWNAARIYPITYASKGKGKLQTPAVIPRKIQPPAWKKNRVESPSNPSYHYIPGSTINILSTDMFTSTVTSAFGQFSFQSRQRKTELLGPYDFGISDPWKAVESKKEEEESENQKFTYQHLITENLELENPKIETPNIRTLPNQRNQKPELIHQQNLPPVIVINQLPINFLAEPIQQSLQLPPQQPEQQQLLQQPPQPPNLDPMAYAPIAKLNNFTGEEDDAQIWLNNIKKNDAQAMQTIPYFLKNTANSWYQSLINKPQDFNAFKVEFLRYFSNNNSINHLVNAFTTIKQGETEAVTTYLGCFHRNLHQIQAIDANYFTAPQILNQFIHGLCSSILQHVRPLHPGMLQDAVTHARDFESTKSEANHAQAVNLVMNGLSELDSKLEKFNESINKRLEGYLETLIVAKINHAHLHQPINSGNRKRVSATIVGNKDISKLTEINIKTPITTTNLLPVSVSTSDSSAAATSNISTAATNYLSTPTNSNTNPEPSSNNIRQPSIQSYSKLKIGDGCSPTDLQFTKLTIRIMHLEFGYQSRPKPKFSTLFKSPSYPRKHHLQQHKIQLASAIFSFELEENTTIPLFSGATLKKKPITAMYTDARVDGHLIKLILDTASAKIITANGVTKTPISEIDNFSFEVNGIMTPIKVLGQHIRVPATCGHFKTPPREKLLIELEKKKEKPTWEAYQEKGKQKEELTWETDDLTWTDHDESKPTSSWEWKEDNKNKGKGKEKETTQTTTAYNTYTTLQQSTYH
ncbi:hypothetical protein G9A89_018951 [Geosiphon pyriformis]|nr:hypothetical protein G9A89_018951 [Geosiphon pyriformis]